MNGWAHITAKRRGRCVRCRRAILVGAPALYNPKHRTLTARFLPRVGAAMNHPRLKLTEWMLIQPHAPQEAKLVLAATIETAGERRAAASARRMAPHEARRCSPKPSRASESSVEGVPPTDGTNVRSRSPLRRGQTHCLAAPEGGAEPPPGLEALADPLPTPVPSALVSRKAASGRSPPSSRSCTPASRSSPGGAPSTTTSSPRCCETGRRRDRSRTPGRR